MYAFIPLKFSLGKKVLQYMMLQIYCEKGNPKPPCNLFGTTLFDSWLVMAYNIKHSFSINSFYQVES